MTEIKKPFINTLSYNLIYVFRINDEPHKNSLKVGMATVKFDENPVTITPNHSYLNIAAKNRIDQYTKTAGIIYELLYTELAITNKGKPFADHDVHKVLINSGIEKVYFANGANEWFKTDLNTVKNAIKAVRKGKSSLFAAEITKNINPIILRPNQKEAVEKTIKVFSKGDRMLWNAKMRFGKTIAALEVVRRMGFRKTIIMTHRPVVDDGWFEDFNMVFQGTKSYKYGSKSSSHGSSIEELEKEGVNYVYFASIQDLRGSSQVGGDFDKNDLVFSVDWDLVIIDEAHEGTETSLGTKVIEQIVKNESEHTTKLLELSGTPFNLLKKFDDDEIYTWDYVMEQRERANWYIEHYGDPNPYEELPQMHIFTYNLDRIIGGYNDVEDMAFNFREFFRVWTDNPSKDRRIMPKTAKIGEFVHKDDVKAFLDLLCKKDNFSNYPFSTDEYREYFRHSLWMVPGVKEAKALGKLLEEHPVFGKHGLFKVVNVAGEGDDYEEKHYADAKKKVLDAITDHPEDTYTITLSCGRLTTGVSIKPWTAIFMLSGSSSVSAQNYLQTIFRAQTPAKIGNRVKDSCYVFDFAPDRTLNMVAQASELSPEPGVVDPDGKAQMGEFLNFCPVIGINGSSMETYSVDTMMQQLKKAHADQVVRNGFDDNKLYNENLLRLDNLEIEEFNNLAEIIGKTKQQKQQTKIDVNNQGMTDEQWEIIQQARNKKKKELTEEQKAALEKLKEAKSLQRKAISILRGISIRIPMLVYGADIEFEKDVTLDNFLDIVDDKSWEEFMPAGVTKEKFKQFSKYYDVDVFISAGRKIRNIAKSADKLNPMERVQKIAGLFATFKNPDKETVLTPWRVVNMHMSSTLGGWCFYDNTFDELNGKLLEPRFVSRGDITNNTLATASSKLLEINSKSGLYPLYIAYSIYRQRCLNYNSRKLDETLEKQIWRDTLKDNVYVITRTKMAAEITKRTLLGYEESESNVLTYELLIDDMKKDLKNSIDIILDSKTWKKKGDKMRFNAVVGNPPYQEEGLNTRKAPLYHLFYDAANKLSNYVTLITPARFLFDAGQTPKKWNEKMLNDVHFKVVNYFPDSKDVFNTVDIKGGVAIGLINKQEQFGRIGIFTVYNELNSIIEKVVKNPLMDFSSMMDIVSSRGLYRFSEQLFIDFPNAKEKLGKGTGNMIASNVFEKLPEVFKTDKTDNSISFIGRLNNERVQRFVDNKYIIQNEYLSTYNVIIPKSNGTGAYGEALSKPIISEKWQGSTDTFISIGAFDNYSEAQALLKYLNTKFLRSMLGIKKATQDNSKNVWEYVPIQDFTSESDIDWNVSIADIDKQLYLKYGLVENEISFIEKSVKEM